MSTAIRLQSVEHWIRITRLPLRAISSWLYDSESSGKMRQCRHSSSFIRYCVRVSICLGVP